MKTAKITDSTKSVTTHVRINGESFASVEYRGRVIMRYPACIASKFMAQTMR